MRIIKLRIFSVAVLLFALANAFATVNDVELGYSITKEIITNQP